VSPSIVILNSNNFYIQIEEDAIFVGYQMQTYSRLLTTCNMQLPWPPNHHHYRDPRYHQYLCIYDKFPGRFMRLGGYTDPTNKGTQMFLK
jgi:hypothetical protein